MAVDATRIAAGLDRAAAVYEAALMLSQVRVYERSEPTFNDTTGEWTTPTETDLYEGEAYIRLGQARPVKTVEIGQAVNTEREWRLRVPRGTASFPIGAFVEITDGGRAAEMTGQTFRIDDFPEGSLATTPLYAVTQYHPRSTELP